jgi:hypothetical protein
VPAVGTETRAPVMRAGPGDPERAAARSERGGSSRRIAGLPTWCLVLGFYVVMALVTIGRHAIGHPRSVCACVGPGDPTAYMWALSWWPHAVVHGLNPFFTHYQWAPTGVNLAQGAMIPSAAIALAPFTALFGPIFSYNLLSVASPVLASLTAYLLCRRLVGRELPALVGGYLFGFSSYDFAQLTGHPNLTLIFLIPLMAHIALRRVDRELSRRAYVLCMALVLVLQAGLSTELLAECVAFGALVALTARLLVSREQRRAVDGLVLETVLAGVLALVVASPFFYYALFSGGLPKGVGYWDAYAQDFLNPFFPTSATLLGHHTFESLSLTYAGGGVTGDDGYLSIPLIIAFVVWALGEGRRRVLRWSLLALAGVSLLAASGAHLQIAGHQTLTLPFDLVKELPVFEDIIPSRIALFTTLAVAIGAAAWLAAAPGRSTGRWLVVLLSAVMIFPNITTTFFGTAPSNPRFFSAKGYKHYLRSGETVLILPYGYNDVAPLWQAEAGFSFYMPEGYVSQFVPSPFVSEPLVEQLELNATPPAPSALAAFIGKYHVSHVLVDPRVARFWPEVLAQMGLHGRTVEGVLLYKVPDSPA